MSKEEYFPAKKRAKETFEKQLKRINQEAEGKRNKIREKYGHKLQQRIAVRRREDISDEEKSKLLDEIDNKFRRCYSECEQAYADREKKFNMIDQKLRETFEPDYEYEKMKPGFEESGEVSDSKIINPKGTRRNCQRCAVALEMRHRGFDVQVSDGEGDGLGMQGSIESCFIGSSVKEFTPSDTPNLDIAVVDQMKEWGDGARCIITKQCNGYGHAFNLVNKGGEIFVEDGQTEWGGGWSDKTSIEAGGKPNMNVEGALQVTLIRTDNAKPSLMVEEYVRRRES